MIGILWWLACFLLLVVVAAAVWVLSFEVRSYLAMKRIEKQGAKAVYVPFTGIGKYLAGDPKDNDQMKMLRDLVEANKDRDIITLNHPDKISSLSLLLKDELLREFFVKESEVANKVEAVENHYFGFLFKSGHVAKEERAIYAKWFSYENLKVISEKAHQMAFEGLLEVGRSLPQPSGWNVIDLKQPLMKVNLRIMNTLLLGDIDLPGVDLSALDRMVEEYCKLNSACLVHKWNMLSRGFLHRHNLLATTRAANRLLVPLSKMVWDIYQHRKAQGFRTFPNILDLLIQHNDNLEREHKPAMPKEEIISHIILMKFAAEHTTMDTFLSGLVNLCKNPQLVRRLDKAVGQVCKGDLRGAVVKFEDASENTEIEQFRREILRKHGGAPLPLWRVITKETCIGKYRFKPGDGIGYVCSLMSTVSKHFDQPDVFDPDRMSKKNVESLQRSAFVPYGMGGRICLGKAQADLMIDVLLVSFFRVFECESDPACSERVTWTVGYGYQNPTLKVKPRFN